MNSYIITTDNMCDLPTEYLEKNSVKTVSLTYSAQDITYGTLENPIQEAKDFYEMMRAGVTPKTTQINPDTARKFFEPLIKEGCNILHIAFSSALSGTFNSMSIAAAELNEEYPGTKILVVDSLCASLGEGLFVDYAVSLRNSGKTMDEACSELEAEKLSFCHLFTVDDLIYLFRGGRVSRTSVIFGTMLGIKPMLHVDDLGRLVPQGRVRGRKASLDDLVQRMLANMTREKTVKFFISHGDCAEDAEYVAKKVSEATGLTDYLIGNVGPVIGSHSGPGTVALFFRGKR